ncbi:Uncharacterized protein TPAR_02209 [Tolypocladium paradoxum]|uniref:Myb-like domain-containing protein n=1 Tax=Tolypocladium paradoxum TaxID=94208 RepID=A0A2S4L579_9HYPO|nr:Uncharacterized protein TPAR_02209 [Tolypocladium paradoxum]
METPQRGARQHDIESRVSASRGPSPTRSALQTAGRNTSATTSNAPSSPADAAPNGSKRGSLSRDAISIPRRGAKVTRAVSVASIPTRTGNENGDGSEADEDEMRQVIIAGLPDLARAADELMTRLSNGDNGDKTSRAILNVKRSAFIHHRESCLQPGARSPFVGWAGLEDGGRPTDIEKAAANVFARANLVSALDYIQNARARGGVEMLNLLEALNSAIPTLFTPPGRCRPPPELAVKLRACYAIESLAISNSNTSLPKSNTSRPQIIASVFCESTDNADFASIIVNGPFRSLGDPQEEEDSDLCSATAYALFVGGRKESGLGHLRARFPLDKLLEELEAWIWDEYPNLQKSGKTSQQGPEVYHDAEKDFEESTSASDSESQAIVRAGDTDKVPSLFMDTQSLGQLEATKSRSDAPPSNQQQAARNRKAQPPVHSNRQILLLDTPTPDPVVNTTRSGSKRAYVTAVEDDEESDPFETDGRPVDNTKRAALQSGPPASKRLRGSAPEPQPSSSRRTLGNPSQTRAAPSSSAPAARMSSQTFVNPSTAREAPSSSAPAGRMSSQVDLGAMRRKTADASAVTRIQQRGYRGATQTRMPWSEDDTILLIELICETNASWAVIENNHNDKFEHPRNQQAYRDKARNLKVEFLSSDAVLPPGFDLVALGPKEVIKVRERGKNHMRQELDIDSRGIPINTAAYA